MSNTLYRKYRPADFSGIIGQQHITQTLQNQLAAGRIGHAYLFCGSRGVGKTSLARIFSYAINCLNPKIAPCGQCKACVNAGLSKGDIANNKNNKNDANQSENHASVIKTDGALNLDIIEIDAASNNGVDDARDLRDKVKYPPVQAKYKVYIIDEVHMLTGSAFNALLKTLEEPPSHAVFILATTEPHKLPATILSRCMRFDFRLVGQNELFDLLATIFKKEGREYQDEALRAIAAAAEGSVRDALSIADTCISVGSFARQDTSINTLDRFDVDTSINASDRFDENSPINTSGVNKSNSKTVLTAQQVESILGGGTKQTEQLFLAVAVGNAAEALTLVSKLYENGKSMNVIAKELASLSRDLMVAKVAPAILNTTNERLLFLTETAKNHNVAALAALVQLFSEMDNVLRYSVSPRIAMEAAVIRAIKLYSLDLNALDERLLKIENKLTNLQNGNSMVVDTNSRQSTNLSAIKSNENIDNSTIKTNENIPAKSNKNAEEFIDDYPPPPYYEDASADYGQLNNQPNGNQYQSNNRSGNNYSNISQADNNQSNNYSGNNQPDLGNNTASAGKGVAAGRQGQGLTAIQLWGKMITYFRRNSTPAFTQVIGRQNPSKIIFNNGVIKIFASRQDFLIMCDDTLQETLKIGLESEGYSVKVKVEKDSTDIDMEKEVSNLVDEFGRSKVNIIK